MDKDRVAMVTATIEETLGHENSILSPEDAELLKILCLPNDTVLSDIQDVVERDGCGSTTISIRCYSLSHQSSKRIREDAICKWSLAACSSGVFSFKHYRLLEFKLLHTLFT